MGYYYYLHQDGSYTELFLRKEKRRISWTVVVDYVIICLSGHKKKDSLEVISNIDVVMIIFSFFWRRYKRIIHQA
jgi:hypothetical protein